MDLVILGNGFDLHCRLGSSYKQFVEYLLSHDINQENIFAYIFVKEKEEKNWVDVESSIEIFLTYIFDKESIEEYQKIYRLAPISRFEDIESKRLEEWYQHLQNMYPHYLIINNIFPGLLFAKNLDDWLKNFETFYSFQKDEDISKIYLKDNYCHLIKKLKNSECTLDEKRYYLIEFFIDELKEIEDYFSEFLNKQIKHRNNNDSMKSYEEMAKDTLYQIIQKHTIETTGIGSTMLGNIKIMSFNYTNPFKNLFDSIKVNNIHGNIDNKTCILGIDIKNITNDLLIPFTKSYRKLKLNQNDNMLSDKEQINNIYFYGHSFGLSDYSYFQALFDAINIYDSSVNLFFYYSEYDLTKKAFISYSEYNKVVDLINSYGGTLNNKDQGETLLPKLLLENRIHIVNLNEKD